MFSKACEYGIKATIYIAMQSEKGNRTSLKEIAEQINSPIAFTAKILQILAREKIIESLRGQTGGFHIDKSKYQQIKLSQIVTAIDGDSIYNGCGLGFPECSELKPCPVHNKFAKIRDELKHMLENTGIKELVKVTNDGLTYLKQ